MKFYTELVQTMNRDVKRVIVAGKNTNELFNVKYTIDDEDDLSQLCTQKFKPKSAADQIERDNIINYFTNSIYTFKEDWYTRQVCYQPKYEFGLIGQQIAACLSCLQAIIRDGKLYLFVFVRSQNFASNFKYDNQTYAYIMRMITNVLEIKMGSIEVHVTSLHEIV